MLGLSIFNYKASQVDSSPVFVCDLIALTFFTALFILKYPDKLHLKCILLPKF